MQEKITKIIQGKKRFILPRVDKELEQIFKENNIELFKIKLKYRVILNTRVYVLSVAWAENDEIKIISDTRFN